MKYNLKELVKDNIANYVFYKDEELWYDINGFTFPIPIKDTGNGKFTTNMKAISLMKWIRAHINLLSDESEE